MRSAVLLAFLGALGTVAIAKGETQTFVIASAPDGYGVDHCLASGARCGAAIADAYCHAQHYARAASFRRLEANELTGSLPVAVERPAEAGLLVAIECIR